MPDRHFLPSAADHVDRRPRGKDDAAAVFMRAAHGVAKLRPDAARVLARCAADGEVLRLVGPSPSWDVPIRLVAAVRWLTLGGEVADYRRTDDRWASWRAAVLEHRDVVARFLEQPVQTNEVQRCFALLPLFLTVARAARRPLDLIELGASGGLNLLWDRYGYRYARGSWGDQQSGLVIRGTEIGEVPASLLSQSVDVRSRRGIDLNPIDIGTEAGVRLVRSYTGEEREDRLMAAIAVARQHSCELIRGNYLELLPALLAERADATLTVVYQTISTIYLDAEQRIRLWDTLTEAATRGPLAWISTPTPEEHGQRRGEYPLEVAMWPLGRRAVMARMDNPGETLTWIGQ